MKKLSILQQTLLLIVCSKKGNRVIRLSALIICVTVLNVFGSNKYSNRSDLLLNSEGKNSVKEEYFLSGNEETKAIPVIQQKKVTGIVTDKNGAPVPGVNVVVTGSTKGTITDVEGKYTIEVPAGSKSLTFSFIGMEPQNINIGTLSMINATMSESAIGLNEVVVVG